MLSVGVELNGAAVAVTLGIEVAGAHRSPNPEVQGQVENSRAGITRDLGGGVGGAVGDDENVDPVPGNASNLLDDGADDGSLVPCRHDRQGIVLNSGHETSDTPHAYGLRQLYAAGPRPIHIRARPVTYARSSPR